MMKITHFFTFVNQSFEEKEFAIQISSTLIQIDDQNFLIDTGFVRHKEIVYILNKIGLSALDIDYVLNTHIHPDHCGGNRFFKNAAIYFSEQDYFFQRDFMNALARSGLDQTAGIIKKFYPDFNDKQVLLYSRVAQEMAAMWYDDMVGNTEQIHYIEREWPFHFIEPVETPGHSLQHYSFKIHAAPKPYLITGDALTTKTSFRMYKLDFPYCYDAEAYLKSQKKIGEFSGIIIPGHDKPFDTETGRYLNDNDSKDDDGNGKPAMTDDDILAQYLK